MKQIPLSRLFGYERIAKTPKFGNSLKRFLIAAACLAAIISIERIYYFQNGGFRASKLISNFPPFLNPPPPKIESLLNQSFHFLGRGGTSFVFLGEDEKTVLKLFKHQHLLLKSPLFHIAFPGSADAIRVKKIVEGQKKNAHKHQSFFFSSCQLAYDELQEETGLIYLCCQPNPHFTQSIRLIDTWGISHYIDLRKTEFAIQQKADLFFPYLEALVKAGHKEEARRAVDALLQQIQTRCRKGIGDRDPNLLINFGFIERRVVEFDLGSYFLNPALKNPLLEAKELFFSTYALQKWLEKHSPELLNHLLDRIAQAREPHLFPE
jgi:hypothetical protein